MNQCQQVKIMKYRLEQFAKSLGDGKVCYSGGLLKYQAKFNTGTGMQQWFGGLKAMSLLFSVLKSHITVNL